VTGDPGLLAHEVLGDDGPLVVLLHGLGGDRSQVVQLLPDQLRSAYRIVAPDLRAHGRSTLDESADRLTFATLAGDVEQLLEAIAPQQDVVLVGISMGAAVAAELMARERLAVRGAVLIRPAWAWRPSPDNLASYPCIAELLQTRGAETGRMRFQATEDYARVAGVSPAAADALLGQFDVPQAVERAHRLSAIPASAPARPDVVPDRPVMVVGGGLDPVHPFALAQQVSSDLGAFLDLVPPRYDEPEAHAVAVSSAISWFLKEVDG
jgi:pimeloyl-ACP methyl ester carboxylesterase